MIVCSKCGQAPEALRMLKCVVCFKPVCPQCSVRGYGKNFCSEDCARIFLRGTGEEYDSPD